MCLTYHIHPQAGTASGHKRTCSTVTAKLLFQSCALVQELRRQGVSTVDYALIDHMGPLYLKDLLILQRSGLLKKGSIVVADNILIPGAPEFRKYLKNSRDFQTLEHVVDIQFSDLICDIVTVSKYVGA